MAKGGRQRSERPYVSQLEEPRSVRGRRILVHVWGDHGVREVEFLAQIPDHVEHQPLVHFLAGAAHGDDLPRWILKRTSADTQSWMKVKGRNFETIHFCYRSSWSLLQGGKCLPTWYVVIGKATPRNPCAMWGKRTSVKLPPNPGVQVPMSRRCAMFSSWEKKFPQVMDEENFHSRHLPQTVSEVNVRRARCT